MRSESLDEHTRRSLEWNDLLEFLASQTHSTMGAEKCRNLKLEDEIGLAQLRQSETTEMVSLLDSQAPFPTLSFHDTRPLLKRAIKGAMLEAHELRDISLAIELLHSVQNCIAAQESQVRALQMVVGNVVNVSPLHVSINRCISKDGEVLENASPALENAIREAQSLKQHIRQRLQHLIASEQYRDVLQEPYFAERESRYVLPVKSDRQGAIAGIVHDASASGATVFVEPRELIELNNRIKVTDLQVTREINRILVELSALVGLHEKDLQHHLDILSSLDCVAAKARLSKLMKAYPVEIDARGRIHLYNGRHPLLTLTKNNVVPNDVFLREKDQVLVISGPNTGGKTVTLKLIGLFAFMVRTGLHLPCGEGSIMGFFPHIFADIGDAQDLKKDLSSFSAHMINIVNLLKIVGSYRATPNLLYLVLIDEVASSTDPGEGAALGEALLRQFAQLGLKVVVTTHYNNLKVLALSSPGFVNASLEIHLPSLSPTYRLIQGFPGGSSAFEIAGHLGLNPHILEQARGLLTREDRRLESLFSELQDTQAQIHKELSKAREERVIAEKESLESQQITERLRASEYEAAKGFKRRFREELSSARKEIQQTVEEFRKDPTADKARKALKTLSSLNQQVVSTHESPAQALPLETLDVGDRVEIPSLDTSGILLESPNGRKRVRIRVGESEVSVPTNVLRGKEKKKPFQEYQQQPSRVKKKMPKDENLSAMPQELESFAAMTIDVRGRKAEDALDHIVAMLDQAALKQFKGIRIIHGLGTGKLKAVTREYLAQSPYILKYRSGSENEGGDGVTMVVMR